jgi:hypothetical protein
METLAPGIRIVERAIITSDMIGEVEKHWQTLRRGRDLPLRADLDPLELKRWLPYLSTIELHTDPFRIRYRVVGTEVARFTGEDFTGKWLHDTDWSQIAKEVNLAIYRRAFETRNPVFGLSGFEAESDRAPYFEWALFPLTADGTTVTHCLSVDDLSTLGRRSRLAGLDRQRD